MSRINRSAAAVAAAIVLVLVPNLASGLDPDVERVLDNGVAFPKGATPKVLSATGSGREGPAWDPELGVLSSGRGHINRWSLEGTQSVFRENANTNGLLFDKDGRLIGCEPKQRRVTRTLRDGTVEVLTDSYDGQPYNQPNDLSLDSKGRIYFSDACYGGPQNIRQRSADGRSIEGVYRINSPGKVQRVLSNDDVERANGVLVSADDRFLFVADNCNDRHGGSRRLLRFGLRDDGTIVPGSRKVLYDWTGSRGPDGVKQDIEGRLYVAAGNTKPQPPYEADTSRPGGIYVIDPKEGTLLQFLPVPSDEVTNCAFGGPDRRDLYITAGGTLYVVRTNTPGRVCWPRQPTFTPPKTQGGKVAVDVPELPAVLADVVASRRGHGEGQGVVLMMRNRKLGVRVSAETSLTSAQWDAIAALKPSWLHFNDKSLTDADMDRLVAIDPEEISLRIIPLTGTGAKRLGDMKRLTVLETHHMKQPTPEACEALENHPALERYRTAGPFCIDALKAPKLKSVEFAEVAINPENIETLASRSTITSLHLFGHNLITIDAPLLAKVADIRSLETLRITKTVVPYEGALEHLGRLPQLKKLELTEVDVSAEDLARLRQALPKVEIRHTPMSASYRATWDEMVAKQAQRAPSAAPR